MSYNVWILEESNISVSGGVSLDGVTQGDGSHLVGQTITLNNNNWLQLAVRDDEDNFDDNDNDQELDGDQTIGGTLYSDGTEVEAEYTIVLRDPNTGIEYTAFGFNVDNSSPQYATVEGLVFVGGQGEFPPTGVALEVVSAAEGPGGMGQPPVDAGELAFPCFTPGTLIATPDGPRRIETLVPGDLVLTRDWGPQPLRWIGSAEVGLDRLARDRDLHPIRIRAGAFGPGQPARDLLVSPQHRILIGGWRAELLFGEHEVLVAAKHLVDDTAIRRAKVDRVCYIHLLFDRHEIIFAEGLETESFLPGPVTLPGLAEETRAELLALFPELAESPASYGPPARPLLQRWEGSALTD